MEPWLDSLSEDWDSEPRLSSPTSSILHNDRKPSTQGSLQSQSRIPHLSQSIRKDSKSFLKPRSARGIAKANGQGILGERSASSLNLPASPRDSLRKSTTSSLPRRTSSNFSESQSSVQHHSVNKDPEAQDTPEWKRRLVKGEEVTSDGFDLFSPSKLEGMFAEPAHKDDRASEQAVEEPNVKPWGSLKLGQFSSTLEQYQSLRATRARPPTMGALHEVSEDEDEEAEIERLGDPITQEDEHDLSAVSSDIVREGSLRGLVRRRVSNLERPTHVPISAVVESRTVSYSSKDPRWRTFSGQQEIKNEVISPITASATNTIRETAVRNSVDLPADMLRRRLQNLEKGRPSSSSSDRDISYTGERSKDNGPDQDYYPEITSHSLPEDLSMGTQDLLSDRRSVVRNSESGTRRQSSVQEYSRMAGREQMSSQMLPSSPPLGPIDHYDVANSSNLSDLLPELLDDTSVVRHSPSPTRPSSGRSPLKLFGNRDTYTSNKLMRVLSQYGQDASTRENSSIQEGDDLEGDSRLGAEFRMSQFGQGELDSFNFEKEVARPRPTYPAATKSENKIFGSIGRTSGVSRHKHRDPSGKQMHGTDEKPKRLPSSPAKDRTPKRRRTLLKDEIFVEGVGMEIIADQLPDSSSAIAGKKRKDARPGEIGGQADANVLAARAILRPKAGSRKSSASSQAHLTEQNPARRGSNPPGKLAEALAAELESFAKGVTEAHQDSRKPSLATKDYMEEANKVMEFIRARGKPMTKLSGIQEPIDISELDSDDILDLEIDDDDSTKESFSRPPSRDRPIRPREDRRIAKHDMQTANQLKKYQEPDDLELLASTSAIGTLNVVDNQAASEAACIPIPEEVQESSPPNIRLSGPLDDIEEGFKSLSISDQKEKQHSSMGSSNHTIATGSSGSSGRKGIISHGTVSIPDKVGTMAFDHTKQMWVKHKVLTSLAVAQLADPAPMSAREATLDDDPFQDIPDLSIDEHREIATISKQLTTSQPRQSTDNLDLNNDISEEKVYNDYTAEDQLGDTGMLSAASAEGIGNELSDEDGLTGSNQSEPESPTKSEVSKHEERLHEGYSSIEPATLQTTRKQARAVTIAFTSPIASHIPVSKPVSPSEDDLDNDDNFLPPEDLDYDEYVPTPKPRKPQQSFPGLNMSQPNTSQKTYSALIRPSSLSRNPMPVIDEVDSNHNYENKEMSLMHIGDSSHSTPRPADDRALIHPASTYKGSSILCLTPLSEFTMHQADAANIADESFVAARPHPKALLQAHGSLALSKDELVKAITDMAPNEPFWENLRQLDLTEKRLSSLNALQDYCPSLEALSIAKNSIVQLNGLPPTLRQLDISMNCLNDFTSWGHLHNLQRIDVSGNKLESLEPFGSLFHLRRLKASNNNIKDIEGVFDLDGLIKLDLSGNDLTHVDFRDADLLSVEHLDLSNNKIAIVRNINCLPRLEHLNLDSNSLRELDISAPASLLTSLSLSHNELEKLDLTRMPSLRTLDIDDNCIRAVDGLCNSTNLRRLSAREQRHSFDFINTILGTPNECDELLLSGNILEDGMIALPPYPHYNLRQLELAGCGLRQLPPGFGDFFPNCRSLNINFNAISEMSPLMGCIKLRELMLAGNRIQRLRRSCLTLSRMPMLHTLDLRDNPLTVGFYSPHTHTGAEAKPFTVSGRVAAKDEKWLQVLDETTALRRRMFELMLADGCRNLQHVDGLSFTGPEILGMQMIWTRLSSKGVIVKPTVTEVEVDSAQQQIVEQFDERKVLRASDANSLHDHERSLVLE